ncbi:hypothetical protein P154DRAFT_600709 [Amniculicola lignicola CBS 123094]|uniref:Uncharacterized protein n=1 Tax=Amniculicola lignicola CBS 123094 TaxID=1392246 RepID=A0A6A5X053_9PLEO|nr:hypothetical protein P154DRAFT_600709 [Amniculicola lignicola CBS 123094]
MSAPSPVRIPRSPVMRKGPDAAMHIQEEHHPMPKDEAELEALVLSKIRPADVLAMCTKRHAEMDLTQHITKNKLGHICYSREALPISNLREKGERVEAMPLARSTIAYFDQPLCYLNDAQCDARLKMIEWCNRFSKHGLPLCPIADDKECEKLVSECDMEELWGYINEFFFFQDFDLVVFGWDRDLHDCLGSAVVVDGIPMIHMNQVELLAGKIEQVFRVSIGWPVYLRRLESLKYNGVFAKSLPSAHDLVTWSLNNDFFESGFRKRDLEDLCIATRKYALWSPSEFAEENANSSVRDDTECSADGDADSREDGASDFTTDDYADPTETGDGDVEMSDALDDREPFDDSGSCYTPDSSDFSDSSD